MPRPRPRLAVRDRRHQRRARCSRTWASTRRGSPPTTCSASDRGSTHGADGPLSPARDLHRSAGRRRRAHDGDRAARRACEVGVVETSTSGNAGGSFYGRDARGTTPLRDRRGARIVVGATITGSEVADFLHAATIADRRRGAARRGCGTRCRRSRRAARSGSTSSTSSGSEHDRAHTDHPRLRPGPRRRDRTAARAREPGSGAARRDDGARQPDAREDHRERPARAGPRRPGEIPVAAGAERPLVRELTVAAHVHGESGLDGPALPPPRHASRSPSTRATSWRAQSLRAAVPVTLVPIGPLTNVALLLERTGGAERSSASC